MTQISFDVIEHILSPFLTNKSLLSLSCVNGEYHNVVRDELNERKERQKIIHKEIINKFANGIKNGSTSDLKFYHDYIHATCGFSKYWFSEIYLFYGDRIAICVFKNGLVIKNTILKLKNNKIKSKHKNNKIIDSFIACYNSP